MFCKVFVVITFLKKNHINCRSYSSYNSFYALKAQLAWVAISEIVLDVSWNIINIVHQLLNFNWSEIYLEGEGLKWRAGSSRSRLFSFFVLN